MGCVKGDAWQLESVQRKAKRGHRNDEHDRVPKASLEFAAKVPGVASKRAVDEGDDERGPIACAVESERARSIVEGVESTALIGNGSEPAHPSKRRSNSQVRPWISGLSERPRGP